MQGRRKDQIEFSYKVCAIGLVCIVALVIALGVWKWNVPRPVDPRPAGPTYNYWIPTDEDMLTLDSLYNIVRETEEDVEELNHSVDRIDSKLDDMIDEQKERDAILYNDEYQMWITGEGDTIYE
jgi:hypothetical protein